MYLGIFTTYAPYINNGDTMSLKKIILISIFVIFSLSFPSHFMFDLFPNVLVSFFFPVNESIWEHMKILYTSILLGNIVKYWLLKHYKISFNNFSFSLVISSFSAVIIYLLIYIPLYAILGENMFISIALMLLVYVIVEMFSYFILRFKQVRYINSLGYVFIIIGYVIFIYFTYKPIYNYLFYDTLNGCYGINEIICKEK